ncbi:hypothetical protein JD844_028987, partial [Phrynosoma platyrhinos]
MLRSSEFNQDKTTLIVTNNPLPLLISGQHLSTPFHFFPEDLVGRAVNLKAPSYLPPVKMPEQQLLGPTVKKLKKSSQFRFANSNDFKTEAHFSKNYAEKRLQRLYPNLRTHARPTDDGVPSQHPRLCCPDGPVGTSHHVLPDRTEAHGDRAGTRWFPTRAGPPLDCEQLRGAETYQIKSHLPA